MFLKGNWIVENKLMIGPWPRMPREDIPDLHPIGVLVNLTETDYFNKELEQKTVDLLNIPIKDYSVPNAAQTLELIRNLSFYDLLMGDNRWTQQGVVRVISQLLQYEKVQRPQGCLVPVLS